jgi:transposase
MEWWTKIRQKVLVEGVSKRQVLQETGIHWKTLEKILGHSSPPGYRLSEARGEPKIGPYRERIAHILDSDRTVHKKQRHTAKRIFERIREEGYTGGYTQVKEAVRDIRKRKQEVFVPLTHRPGEAQMDFGFALAKINGVLKKIVFFVMSLPHSDAVYVQAFERICTEVMWEGHIRCFAFFGGVPSRITYDNDRTLVGGILGPRERKLTTGFLQLVSHYLFDPHFCLVRRANEKGVVESMVRYTRKGLEGQTKDEILFGADNIKLMEGMSPKIQAIAASEYADKSREEIRGSGYVVESLEAALWCFSRTDTYRDAILTAVNLGDDADTTAAVCGQIAGAHYGEDGIPPAWREKLAMRNTIESMADQLFELSGQRLGS